MDIEKQLERGILIDIAFALQSLRPGAQWVLAGKEFTRLQWYDEEQDQPSEQEVLDEIERLTILRDQLAYRAHRIEEYPSIEDLTVALAELEEGQPEMWNRIKAERQAVKDKYPKPANE